MTYIEMLKALNVGKKVRYKTREEGRYVHLVNGLLFAENGDRFVLTINIYGQHFATADVWEIYKKPIILEVKEKKYLEDVIQPFRDKDIYIKKRRLGDEDWLIIYVDGESILLPRFKSNTMYRNMELNKDYTPDELKLFERSIY